MKEPKAPKEPKEPNEEGETGEEGEKKKKKKAKKKPKPPCHPKGAKGAFMIYAMATRERKAAENAASEHPVEKLIIPHSEIAETWKNLDAAEREPWDKLAAEDKVRHGRDG